MCLLTLNCFKEPISAFSSLGPIRPKSLKLTTTEPTNMIGSNPTELLRLVFFIGFFQNILGGSMQPTVWQ